MAYKHQPTRLPIAWILVADRARARIFQSDWPIGDQLEEIDTLVHPVGQMRESEVVSDDKGRFSEVGAGPHYGEPRTDFRHRTANDFALIVADRLEKGRVGNKFGHLVVIAPALYLGVLRNTISDPLAKLVQCEIAKDYTLLSSRELLPLLQQSRELIPTT
jgi:protein required for attachment to host cells